MSSNDKKIVGYDSETGFPIYGESNDNSVLNNNLVKVKCSIPFIISLVAVFIPLILILVSYVLYPQPEETKHVSDGAVYFWHNIFVFFSFACISVVYCPMIFINRLIDKKNAKLNKKYSFIGIVINIIALALLIFFSTITFIYFKNAYLSYR